MSIEEKIEQLYMLIMNGETTDSNIDDKMSKIIRYVIKQRSCEKTLQRKQREIAALVAENTVLKKKIEELSNQIDTEQKIHAQYNHNLWQILERLNGNETTIRFKKQS